MSEIQPSTSNNLSPKNNGLEKNTKPDFNVSDFPVHTMQDDLKSTGNSPVEEKRSEVLPSSNQEEKNSPFLSQENWSKQTPVPVSETKTIPSSGISKVIILVIAILIILIAGGAGYYFWTTKYNQPENIPETPVENINEKPEIIPQEPSDVPAVITPTLPEFSTSQPNYLSFDITNSNATQIKEVLRSYAQKVSQFNPSTPVEFLVTDISNSQVSFSIFAQKSGLTLSPEIIALAEPGFSLYYYPNKGSMRLGMSVLLRSGSQVEALLVQNEKNLTRQLEPLYLPSSYTFSDGFFSTSGYNGRTIHYKNIPSSEELSVDYTVFNNQLVIGTSQMTLRSILDYMDQGKIIRD